MNLLNLIVITLGTILFIIGVILVIISLRIKDDKKADTISIEGFISILIGIVLIMDAVLTNIML